MLLYFFAMYHRPPISTPLFSSAASYGYKRQRIYKTDFIKQNGGYVESTPFADWELSVLLSFIEPPTKVKIQLSVSEPFNHSESFSNREWAQKISESRIRLFKNTNRPLLLKVQIIYLLKAASALKNELKERLKLK